MSNPNFPYTIIIRQQPIQGRMCGLKDVVDRRVLDPPLIIEIQNTRSEANEIFLQPNSFVCHLSIFSVSKQECMSVVAYENSDDCVSYQKLLLGDEPAPGVLLKDPVTSKNGIFFVFHKLSVRFAGTYRLCCTIIDMQGPNCEQIFTEPFEVFSSKRYPGGSKNTAFSESILKSLKRTLQ